MGSRLRPVRLAFLASLMLLPAVALGQPGFHAVHSRDGLDAWAVGDAGVYYRSLDGGSSWSQGTLGSTRLRGVVARGLTVIAVGDSGKIWRSTNSGGTWSVQVVAGAPHLMAIAMPTDSRAFVVGAGGTILESADGGATWTPQASGTPRRLNAVHFADELYGWAVGENGTALSTGDGGAQWTASSTGTTRELYGVMQRGSHVWLVGSYGTALKSVNGGTSFTPQNLRLDAHSDVRAVWLQSADSVYLAGGGGFMRRSVDGGASWTFPVHSMHGQISDFHVAGATAFVVSNRHRLPMSSIDRGTTWRMPTGATISRSWALKQTFFGQMRGSTIGINDHDPNTLYAAMGNIVYRSRDEGETWSQIAVIDSCNKVNAFIVSPKDSNVFVAAVAGVIADRLVRSDDHGSSWYTTIRRDFGEYGIPLEYDHDRPDTMYFGVDFGPLHRSIDGGKNWEEWSIAGGGYPEPDGNMFRSPCDIVVVPESNGTILIGDGITAQGQGKYWKSTDHGRTFTLKATRPPGASEIPGMANSRLRPSVTFGTNWGGGGVQRSPDFGETWPSASTVSSAWGVDIARDDPNLVIFGVYSGGNSWLSIDGGSTFTNTPLTGSNYSFFLRDRGLILAEQAGGIYKMSVTYSYTPNASQSAFLVSPNGGEMWGAGTTHDLHWTAVNVPLVSLELRPTPAEPWMMIAQVPGYYGHYSWVVPNTPSSQAKVRVRDAWDSAPEDSSNGVFTITGVAAAASAPATSFALWQNRPNPFTGATQIAYSLPFECEVDLEVYNLQGQRVATLVRGRQSAGVHSVAFGRGAVTASGERLASLPTGVYFYRMQAGAFGSTRKMLLLH